MYFTCKRIALYPALQTWLKAAAAVPDFFSLILEQVKLHVEYLF